jgi:hypothetical protein
MRRLSEFIVQARKIGDSPKISKEESPIFEGFEDYLVIYQEILKPYLDENNSLSQEAFEAVWSAYMWGASTALSLVKHGQIIRNEEGIVQDKIFYSTEELLNEAECLLDPQEGLENAVDALVAAQNIPPANMEFEDDLDMEECDCDICSSQDDSEEDEVPPAHKLH